MSDEGVDLLISVVFKANKHSSTCILSIFCFVFQSFKVPISIVENFETEHPGDTISVYVVTSFDGVDRHGSNYR